MIIRQFCIIAFLSLCVASSGYAATAKIILLETMTLPLVQLHSEWFLKQLAEIGYVEGKNLKLLRLNAEGNKSLALSILNDGIEEMSPDLIVTNATLASIVAKETLSKTNIPQLFFGVSDPVGAGLIEAVGKPTQSTITGMVHSVPRTTIIEMIRQIIDANNFPKPVRFGYIHSDYPSSNGDIEKLQKASELTKDISFVVRKIPYKKGDLGKEAMLANATTQIRALEDSVDFWWQPRGPIGINPEYTKILLEQSAVPIMVGATLTSTKMGALLSFSTDPETQGRETAILADAILKGENPGELPPKRPSKLQIGLNLSTASRLKLVLPSKILKLAKENIFH